VGGSHEAAPPPRHYWRDFKFARAARKWAYWGGTGRLVRWHARGGRWRRRVAVVYMGGLIGAMTEEEALRTEYNGWG
jgi:hypothetical protein